MLAQAVPLIPSRSIPSQFPGYYPSSSKSLASPSCSHSHLLVLGLDKWLEEPHNLCPGSETPSEKRVGSQADHSLFKLLDFPQHSADSLCCLHNFRSEQMPELLVHFTNWHEDKLCCHPDKLCPGLTYTSSKCLVVTAWDIFHYLILGERPTESVSKH